MAKLKRICDECLETFVGGDPADTRCPDEDCDGRLTADLSIGSQVRQIDRQDHYLRSIRTAVWVLAWFQIVALVLSLMAFVVRAGAR